MFLMLLMYTIQMYYATWNLCEYLVILTLDTIQKSLSIV